jgi:hypothetical protein
MIAPVGTSNWTRINSAKRPEMMKNNKPTIRYWTPMILWSIEKMYFVTNDFGSGWM